MKQNLIKTLISEKYLAFGIFELKNGRMSPYLAKSPNKEELSESAFQLLARNALSLFSDMTSFHIIGLANSGTKLTHSIFDAIRSSSKDITCEIINPKHSTVLHYNTLYNKPIVVVDNAITTGKTLINFQQKLINECGCGFSTAIRIFDRMEVDNESGTIDDYLFENYGITVKSILNVLDLIAYLSTEDNSEELQRLENYYTVYCQKRK